MITMIMFIDISIYCVAQQDKINMNTLGYSNIGILKERENDDAD